MAQLQAKILDNIWGSNPAFTGLLQDKTLPAGLAASWGCHRPFEQNDPQSLSDAQIEVQLAGTDTLGNSYSLTFLDKENMDEYNWNSADKPPNSYPGSAATYQSLDDQIVRVKGIIANSKNAQVKATKLYAYDFSPCGSDYGRLANDLNYQGANKIPEQVQLSKNTQAFGTEMYVWQGLDAGDTSAHRTAYATRAQNTAKIARAMDPNKPLIAFMFGMSGDQVNGQNVPQTYDYFLFQLQTCAQLFDYVQIWFGSSWAFSKTLPWYMAVIDFMKDNAPGIGNANLIEGDGGGIIPVPPVNPVFDAPVNMATSKINGAPATVTATAFYNQANGVPPNYVAGAAAVFAGASKNAAGMLPLYRCMSPDRTRFALMVGPPNYTPGSGWIIDGPVMCYISKAQAKGLVPLVACRYDSPAGNMYVSAGADGTVPLGYKTTGELIGYVSPNAVPPPPVDQSKAIALLKQGNAAIVGSVPAATTDINSAIAELSK